METQTPSRRTAYLVLAIVIVLLVVGGIVAFSRKNHTGQNAYVSVAPLPKESMVSLTDSGFQPQTVNIAVGGAVRWRNDSTQAKASVNSDDHPTHRKFPEMNLGTFTKGFTLVHIFTKPGTYTYHDHFHPDWKGTVVVK